jgi:hypothetical protein
MRATCACGESCGSNALNDESAWLLNRGDFDLLGMKALSTAATRGGIALRSTSHGFVAQRCAHWAMSSNDLVVATGCGDNTFVIDFNPFAMAGTPTRSITKPSTSRFPNGTCTRIPVVTKSEYFAGTS